MYHSYAKTNKQGRNGGSMDTKAPRTAALSMERIPSKKITWIMM
jgi:hypothetical protein